MPTKHCSECEPGTCCGKGHVYVIQFKPVIEEVFKDKSKRGYLYVGKTEKSVEERFKDTFTRRDGTFIDILSTPKLDDDTFDIQEDGQWHYNTRSMKKIRKYFLCHRPDLFYYDINPIILDKKQDPKRLERRETGLAEKLRNRGWKVKGPTKKK